MSSRRAFTKTWSFNRDPQETACGSPPGAAARAPLRVGAQRGVPRRGGATYLEVQVAFVVFMLGVSGILPLTVMQTRLARRLQDRIPADHQLYLVRSENDWAVKLGTPAALTTTPPDPRTQPAELVDDADGGFTLENCGPTDWTLRSNGYRGQARRHGPDRNGNKATWTLPSLAPARYEVYITYTVYSNRASNAPFTIYDAQLQLAQVQVNQRQAPSGPTYDGVAWQSLGRYPISSGTLRVTLTDDADGYVSADAVRVVAVSNDLQILATQEQPETQTLTVEVQVTPP